jgi:hypothetical protein
MKIMLISNVENTRFESAMRSRGSSVFHATPERALFIFEHLPDAPSADMILLDVRIEGELAPPDFLAAVGIAGHIRKLPDRSAMADGRKWKNLPIVWIKYGDQYRPPLSVFTDRPEGHFYELTFGYDVTSGYRTLREIAWNYFKRLADEYTDIGYLVTDDNGRMRIDIAYAPPSAANTQNYYRQADNRKAKTYTLARSLEGDENDLSDFSALIEPRARTTEHRIHRFLADAPHVLTLEPVQVMSHVRIGSQMGRREPDFIERPYVDRSLPESWWIVEIKRAFPSSLADLKRGEPRLAAALMTAAGQVRAYKALIETPESREQVLKALGGVPRDATIAILIGRRPRDYGDILQSRFKLAAPDVTLITYDDLFEVREAALSLVAS